MHRAAHPKEVGGCQYFQLGFAVCDIAPALHLEHVLVAAFAQPLALQMYLKQVCAAAT